MLTQQPTKRRPLWARSGGTRLPRDVEDRNSESRRNWLTDAAFIIFVATLTAYAYAYLYEFGFCSAVGIPWQFISLEPRDLVVNLVAQGLLWLLLAPLMLQILVLFWGPSPSLTHLPSEARLRILVLFIFVVAFTAVYPGRRVKTFIAAIIVAVLIFFLPLLVKEIRPRRVVCALDFFLAWVALLFLSCRLGVLAGATEKNYLVLASSPDIVVLRVYSGKLITARHNKDTGAVENKFTVLDAVGREVKWESTTKPLHVQRSDPIGPPLSQ